jgi:DNA polymerase-3 subunit gamma/tau
MATLYRKYRPQQFSEVVGQNHIKITLEHEIASGKIAHAYLFCGPRAVGKTTVARILAKAINCLKRKESESEPCNKCEMCKEITAGRSLDIIEVDAASHTGVDNVRENIIANARVAPARCQYKVFIIDEVHMLSISAFNALLKVIEEPPEYVIFILCTTEVHKVPTTIISRCQRFDFKRISVGEITKKLQYMASKEKIRIDRKILETIARQSEGHMRDAESLLGQIAAISPSEQTGGHEITPEEADLVIPRSDLIEAINLIDNLAKKDAGAAIGLINKLIDEGIDLKRFLTDLIELLRKIMITKINPALAEKLGLELGESMEAQVSQVSRDLVLGQIIVFMEKFIEARNNLRGSFISQLPVEIAITELCTISSGWGIATSPPSPASDSPSQKLGQAGRSKVSSNSRPATTNQDINNDIILAKWHEVLAKVKKYNHSLSFILRVCRPMDINGRRLCLAFKYKFHKERVGDPNIKKLVEKVLQEVYGLPLLLEAVIDEDLAVSNGELVSNDEGAGDKQVAKAKVKEKDDEEDNLAEKLLKTFGGKIIK